MTRTVPGSGAEIFPVFNSIFGVRDVYVINGGEGYDPNDPPRLRIGNCGTPIRDAVLRAVVEGEGGVITAVEVIDPGEGYDPLRLKIEDANGDGAADGNVFLKPDGSLDFIQVTVAGDGFGAGGYLRFSFATNTETIISGIKRIKDSLKKLK